MNSRERVLAALNHQQPDRAPIDLSGHRSSGIAAIAYAKLRKYLELPEKPIRVYDPLQQLAIVDEDVLDLFGVDTIELGRAFCHEDKHWSDWVLPDGTPCQMPAWAAPERDEAQQRWLLRSPRTGDIIAQMPDGALYFEQTKFPFLDEPEDLDKLGEAFTECMWTGIATPSGPLASGEEGRKLFAAGAQNLRESTDRAIIGLFGGNLLEIGQMLFRNDNFFMILAGEPDRAHAFLDALVELHLKNLEGFLGSVGEYIDVILFGDDLGMQTAPQISPDMYREFFKPRHAKMWQRAKELADVKVNLHSCGSIRALLPDLIDAGLDAVNPVQINCTGMDAKELKDEFGDRLTLWGGGCDTGRILPQGTPEEIAAHVREQIATLNPGGGFIFQQVHNIMADVPPENIVAMLKAAQNA